MDSYPSQLSLSQTTKIMSQAFSGGFVGEELVMENGGEGGGAFEEEEEDLNNQQLLTDVELEALLSAALSLPEESTGMKIHRASEKSLLLQQMERDPKGCLHRLLR
jgi:hypothetical protein